MNKKALQSLFIAFSLLAFAAIVYHIIGAIKPFDATPTWRHSLFIGINIICIYGLLKRPNWFVLVLGDINFTAIVQPWFTFFKITLRK